MSGTPARDKGKIAFIRHDDKKAIFDITCTRRNALGAHAVLHVVSKLCDGTAKYWHRMQPNETLLSEVCAVESGRALGTALGDPVYRDAMLSEAVADWEAYRHNLNSHARMIVICDKVKTCRAVVRYLKDHHPKWIPVLAVSNTVDGEESGAKSIRSFRDQREGQILVTCQMAYEGLDVPDCTHLVCLTNIRSRSWLEQAFARVTRFDPKCGLTWEEQCAYLYAPSDPAMVHFLSEWLDEQDSTFVEPVPKVRVIGIKPLRSTFSPESCEPGDVYYGDTNGKLPDVDQSLIRRFNAEYPSQAKKLALSELLSLARGMWPMSRDTGT